MEQRTETAATPIAMPSRQAIIRFVLEVIMVAIPFFFYFLTRGVVADRASEAFVRGAQVVDLERQLGIFREAQLQELFLPKQWLIDLFNFIYFWGHFPLILGLAVPLYIWRRHVYLFLRNAFIASGAIGLIIYATFPVAPPRLMPHLGFVDTMERFSDVSYQSESMGTFTNPFAAVPSLHFGWALVLGIVFVWMFRHPLLRLFGLLWPLTQFAAIVITGNHFFFDAFAGGVVSMMGFGMAYFIHTHAQRRAERAQLEEAPSPHLAVSSG